MWPFQRKPRNNKRQDRNQILNVKLSDKEQQRARWRWARILFMVSTSLMLLIYGAWRGVDWMLDRMVYHNPAYALLELDIQTDGVLAVDQLRRWAGVRIEDNLFSLDLPRIKRDLELCSAVQSVAVERVLPHTLKIRVAERIPVAQFLPPGVRSDQGATPGCYQLDTDAWILLPLTAQQRSVAPQPDERYPLLTGFALAQVRPGCQAESSPVRAALQFLTLFEHSPMAGRAEVQQIDLSVPGLLQILTVQNSQVTLRTRDLEKQLHRWFLVYETGVRQSNHIATLDLSVSENAPLRWAESSVAPPPAPRARRPLPYRRRHV